MEHVDPRAILGATLVDPTGHHAVVLRSLIGSGSFAHVYLAEELPQKPSSPAPQGSAPSLLLSPATAGGEPAVASWPAGASPPATPTSPTTPGSPVGTPVPPARPHGEKRAVKRLFKQGLDRRQQLLQRQEAEVMKAIAPHLNIVRLLATVEDDESLYLIMEYCELDLYEAITQQGGFPDDVVKEVFGQISDAVLHCHAFGYYHRDLKPENLLISSDFKIKLADFGLATADSWSTEMGCGSVRYMAPECFDPLYNVPETDVAAASSPVEMVGYSPPANDVWALGVILINLLFGKNPWFEAHKSDAIFHAYCHHNPNILRQQFNLSPQFDAVLRRAFELDPVRRCSVADLKHMVDATTVFVGTPAPAPAPALPYFSYGPESVLTGPGAILPPGTEVGLPMELPGPDALSNHVESKLLRMSSDSSSGDDDDDRLLAVDQIRGSMSNTGERMLDSGPSSPVEGARELHSGGRNGQLQPLIVPSQHTGGPPMSLSAPAAESADSGQAQIATGSLVVSPNDAPLPAPPPPPPPPPPDKMWTADAFPPNAISSGAPHSTPQLAGIPSSPDGFMGAVSARLSVLDRVVKAAPDLSRDDVSFELPTATRRIFRTPRIFRLGRGRAASGTAAAGSAMAAGVGGSPAESPGEAAASAVGTRTSRNPSPKAWFSVQMVRESPGRPSSLSTAHSGGERPAGVIGMLGLRRGKASTPSSSIDLGTGTGGGGAGTGASPEVGPLLAAAAERAGNGGGGGGGVFRRASWRSASPFGGSQGRRTPGSLDFASGGGGRDSLPRNGQPSPLSDGGGGVGDDAPDPPLRRLRSALSVASLRKTWQTLRQRSGLAGSGGGPASSSSAAGRRRGRRRRDEDTTDDDGDGESGIDDDIEDDDDDDDEAMALRRRWRRRGLPPRPASASDAHRRQRADRRRSSGGFSAFSAASGASSGTSPGTGSAAVTANGSGTGVRRSTVVHRLHRPGSRDVLAGDLFAPARSSPLGPVAASAAASGGDSGAGTSPVSPGFPLATTAATRRAAPVPLFADDGDDGGTNKIGTGGGGSGAAGGPDHRQLLPAAAVAVPVARGAAVPRSEERARRHRSMSAPAAVRVALTPVAATRGGGDD
ncbi:hypothetical protein HK405_003101 [Cladochytrium tenue]|nr:hypothetical protein HK405_003101 [Cladochytrium tenue]